MKFEALTLICTTNMDAILGVCRACPGKFSGIILRWYQVSQVTFKCYHSNRVVDCSNRVVDCSIRVFDCSNRVFDSSLAKQSILIA